MAVQKEFNVNFIVCAIRICKDRNVLKEYFESKEQEVGCGYYDDII